MLEVQNIKKIFKSSQGEIKALDNINISFPEKGLVFVNGESGSGKTTLLNILSGLDKPTSGKIFYNNIEISDNKEREWSYFRNIHTGIVFQDFNLIEDLNVMENLLLPLKIQFRNCQKNYEIVKSMLEYVGLAGYENRKVCQLSAGQKQRIAIARAIIKGPDILLADEATGNLDPENSIDIMELFEKISKRCLVVLISHDNMLAKKYADRIITLANGKIIHDIDNSITKELSMNLYKVTIKNLNKNVIRTENISLEKIEIKDEIKRDDSFDLLQKEKLTLEINIEKSDICNKRVKQFVWEKAKLDKRLSNKLLIRESLRNLKKNKGKMIMTFFLLSAMCMIFFVCTNILLNDYIKTLSDYVSNNSNKGYFVSKNCEKEENNNVVSVNLVKGSNFMETLLNVLDEKDIIKCFQNCEIIYGNDNELSDTTNILEYSDCKFFEKILIKGKLPKNCNEIALDKECAISNNLEIADKIVVLGVECTIVGIANYTTENDGGYSVISKNAMKAGIQKAKSICLQGTNITCSANVDNYAYSASTIAPVKCFRNSKNKMIYGTYPKTRNEFIISKQLAEDLEITDWSKAIKKYRLPNLYDKRYKYIYDNISNLFDYMGKNVSLVGIYDLKAEDKTFDIVLNDDVYGGLVDNYLEKLNYDECMLYLEKNNYKVIKFLTEKGYIIDDVACKYIYSFKDITEKIRKFSLVIHIFLLLIIVTILISFFSYRVKDSMKKIGILRAMGVRTNDIGKQFLFENIMIITISEIISLIVTGYMMLLINNKILMLIQKKDFDMFNYNYKVSILLSIMIFILGIIVTIVPFVKLIRKQSINLINNSKG